MCSQKDPLSSESSYLMVKFSVNIVSPILFEIYTSIQMKISPVKVDGSIVILVHIRYPVISKCELFRLAFTNTDWYFIAFIFLWFSPPHTLIEMFSSARGKLTISDAIKIFFVLPDPMYFSALKTTGGPVTNF